MDFFDRLGKNVNDSPKKIYKRSFVPNTKVKKLASVFICGKCDNILMDPQTCGDCQMFFCLQCFENPKSPQCINCKCTNVFPMDDSLLSQLKQLTFKCNRP